MSLSTKSLLGSFLCLTLALSGCKGSEKKKGSAPTVRAATSKAKESVRAGRHVVRSLLAEAARAELEQRGLFMHFGTADQHKYTLGGWKTGWAETGAQDGIPYARMERRARLRFSLRGAGAQKLVFRGRSPGAPIRIKLKVDGEHAGQIKLGKGWAEHAVFLKEPLAGGHHRLSLEAERPGARLAWIWFPEGQNREAPLSPRVGALKLDRPMRALLSTPPHRLTYHLVVPEDGALVFDYGSRKPTRFRVLLARDGAEEKVSFEGLGKPAWQQAQVDLAAHAGQVVRLTLETTGEGGGAGWGEPDLVRPGPRPSVPLVTSDVRAKNLIYILIDTARQDAFSVFNRTTRVKTPTFDNLVTSSLVFTDAYNNDNWTKPSVATILSGMYPSTHGTTGKWSVLPREVTLLSQHLRDQGFSTAGFIANGYISDKFGFKKGWGTYKNCIREETPCEADKVYGDARGWLDKRGEGRFFLYIQAIDPHVPYAVPRKWLEHYFEGEYEGSLGPSVSGYETKAWRDGKREFDSVDKAYIRALYDAELTYHDHYMGEFMHYLEEKGLLENTLVVVSNDHGEEMFDHGKIGHGHSLYDELLRNPLLMRFPSLLPAGQQVSGPVETVDLAPTLLDLLKAEPLKEAEGVSLMPTIFGIPPLGEKYAVSEQEERGRAIRLGPYKLIVRKAAEQLFNLDEDLGEARNLLASHPVARRACEVYLGEALATPAKSARLAGTSLRRKLKAGDATVDDKLRKQLEALGYID